MAGVIADPKQLKDLARTLSAAADDFETTARKLRAKLSGAGWDDAEGRRFQQDFETTLSSLMKFSERIRSGYVPELQRKASALESYQGR